MTLVRLTRKEKNEAIETLVAAFHDYPVMRYVLKTSGEDYETQVRSLIGFFCEGRLAKNGHFVGVRTATHLAAIALIDEAFQTPWPDRENELSNLQAVIGEEAFGRLDLYEKVSSDMEPQAPHFFLGMIGVRPEDHGGGYGRMLLEHVKTLSVNDRRSAGVCLSTENPKNVSLYEHFGYHTIAESQIAELHSWCLFLPTLGMR